MERPARLVLRPARGLATAWAVAGAGLLASGVWLVVDSGGAPLAWVAIAVFAAVASYFVLQALVPAWFTLVCDEDGIRGRTPWRAFHVAWSDVDLAGVERFAGDPLLRLHVHEPVPDVIDVLLPVGADVPSLHEYLRLQLGSAPTADPGRGRSDHRRRPHDPTTPRSAP